jgi:hypothetical protein
LVRRGDEGSLAIDQHRARRAGDAVGAQHGSVLVEEYQAEAELAGRGRTVVG